VATAVDTFKFKIITDPGNFNVDHKKDFRKGNHPVIIYAIGQRGPLPE
jgi:hypothetical protein